MTWPDISRPVVGVSLKAYFDRARLDDWLAEVAGRARAECWSSLAEVFVLPDLVAVPTAVAALAGTGVAVGAQDVSARDFGATTGDVPARRLAEEGCTLVAVGHAERRALHGETDDVVAAKVARLASAGLTPLVCVGEPSPDDADAAGHCGAQVAAALAAWPDDRPALVAYEPVWAIGASEPAPVGHVAEVVAGLRERFAGREVRFLYGGSAGPGLLGDLGEIVDGVFLGRFAHDPAALAAVVAEARRAPTNPS